MNMSRRKIAIMLLTFVAPRIMSMQAPSQTYADLSKTEAKTPTEEQYKAAIKAQVLNSKGLVRSKQNDPKRNKALRPRTSLSRIQQPK